MAAIQRGNVQSFQEKIGTGNSLYLKGKDFENARRIRPILWLHNGAPTDVLTFLEGWHVKNVKDERTKKVEAVDKPIRFNTDDVIPEDLNWKMSSFKGAPAKPQTPKPCIAFVAWDYLTKSVKITPFSQASVTGHIANMLNPTTPDGAENEMYVEDLTKIDLVILKGEKDNDPYTVTIKPIKSTDYPPEAMRALADFKWSWDAFMRCDQPTESEDSITYADVVDVATANDPTPAASKTTSSKPAAKPAAKQVEVEAEVVSDEFTYNKDWRSVKTPQNALLGDQTIEKLQTFKDTLDKLKAKGTKVSDVLYNSICSGLKDLGKSSGQEEEPEVLF